MHQTTEHRGKPPNPKANNSRPQSAQSTKSTTEGSKETEPEIQVRKDSLRKYLRTSFEMPPNIVDMVIGGVQQYKMVEDIMKLPSYDEAQLLTLILTIHKQEIQEVTREAETDLVHSIENDIGNNNVPMEYVIQLDQDKSEKERLVDRVNELYISLQNAIDKERFELANDIKETIKAVKDLIKRK